jgi:hypothetical protein
MLSLTIAPRGDYEIFEDEPTCEKYGFFPKEIPIINFQNTYILRKSHLPQTEVIYLHKFSGYNLFLRTHTFVCVISSANHFFDLPNKDIYSEEKFRPNGNELSLMEFDAVSVFYVDYQKAFYVNTEFEREYAKEMSQP